MRFSSKLNNIVHELMRWYLVFQYTRKLREIKRAAAGFFRNKDKCFERKYGRYWQRLLPKANPEWCHLYIGTSGTKDIRFVPEDVFYGFIERCLNNSNGSKGYVEDKCDVNFYIPKEFRPKTILAYDRGVYFDEDFSAISRETAREFLGRIAEDVIGKLTIDTSGGVGVALYKPGDLTVEYIERNFEGFIVQECVKQETILASFNPSSLNTCRLVTFRRPWSGEVSVIAGMLRTGGDDSPVDNVTSGGICIDIDSNGILANEAFDYRFRKHTKHMKTGVKFGGPVPFYEKMSDAVCLVAKHIPGYNILGFDVAVDDKGDVKIIEINANSISMKVQTRRPLFGDETEKVIEWCLSHKQFDRFEHFRTWY